jgi:hypothetical protein
VAPFTKLDVGHFRNTLCQKLIPLADGVRDLATQLGARPYRVFLVKTQWSEGERGLGIEEIIEETEILPVPKLSSMDGIALQLQSIGIDEIGTTKVSEISGRYTEDQLRGLGPGGEELPKDQNFYWEIVFMRTDGEQPRRRFLPRGVPDYKPTRIQWEVTLLRASRDRQRDGSP